MIKLEWKNPQIALAELLTEYGPELEEYLGEDYKGGEGRVMAEQRLKDFFDLKGKGEEIRFILNRL